MTLLSTSTYADELVRAAAWGDVKLLRALLVNGADPNAADSDGELALTIAAYWGHYYAVIALLAAGADVNQPGEDGLNALEVAIAQDFPQVASVLYNVGGQRTDRLDKYLAMVEEALCSTK